MRFTSSSPVEIFRVLKVAVRVSPVRRQPMSPASASSAADSFRWGISHSAIMAPEGSRGSALEGAMPPNGMAGTGGCG
ncbi:hypothetical protein J2X98_004042 [Pseudarthrobacter enclensis]|uniref:Uncharacterized protein n=1 Tax=Pseudarthrobacter enclensis TaxID=993070 RepID=A0ABT9RYV5_9MICC|nr:hypothetical protein [Pseudarthrobacter enclensis]